MVVGLFLYHCYLVWNFAVDVPFWDEWEYFNADATPASFTWRWLIGFHNVHRIVPTRLLAWLNLRAFGLDFALQQMLNCLVYGGVLVTLARLKDKIAGVNGFPLFPAFVAFLLSPIAWENHAWSFQSQIHLVLLFLALALYHAFDVPSSGKSLFLCAAYALLAMFSFSAGIVFAVVLLITMVGYGISRRLTGHDPASAGWSLLVTFAILVASGISAWFIGYEGLNAPPLVMPTSPEFWRNLLRMVSLGFGITEPSPLADLCCALFVVVPAVLLLVRRETRWQSSTWKVITAIVAILASLAVIVMGRTGLGTTIISKYTELAFMLLPFVALAWWLAFPTLWQRRAAVVFVWGFAFVGYLDDWSDAGYHHMQKKGTDALECIDRYYRRGGDGVCPNSFSEDLGVYLDRARRLDVEFTRQYRQAPGREPRP